MTDRVFSIVIAAPAERVWTALTSPDDTVNWYFGNTVESDWQPGSPITYRGPDGEPDIEGTIRGCDPPRLLETTFKPVWAQDVDSSPESLVQWRLEMEGDLCRVTVTHTGLPDEGTLTTEVLRGWTFLLSSLKTLLETGAPLVNDTPNDNSGA